MKISIVHLSDLHFKTNEKLNYVTSRSEKIVDALSSLFPQPDAFIILVSGDITFSGQEKEFFLAKMFFQNLIKSLQKQTNKSVFIDFVPGNHDCDLSKKDKVRSLVRENLKESEIDQEIIIKMTECQNNFWHFYKDFVGVDWDSHSFSERTITFKNETIDIQVINSAWEFDLNEKPGSIIFPIDSIRPSQVSKSKLVITVMHHPYGWFQPDVARSLRKKIESCTDLILLGHEHDSEGYKKISRDSSSVQYSEGSILQEDTFDKFSGFNVLVVDFDKLSSLSFYFMWESKTNIFLKSQSTEFQLTANPTRANDIYTLSSKFKSFLGDIGVNFTHPNRENLILSDLFIYPGLRTLDKKSETFEKSIISSSIKEYFSTKKKIIVLGAEKIGKTTLCKKLVQDFFEDGKIPIYIDGLEIKNFDSQGLEKCISATFSNEYQSPSPEFFIQDKKIKKVLLMDNFEKCRIPENQRQDFLNTVCQKFETVIFFGNFTENFFSTAIDPKKNIYEQLEFSRCEIIELNPKKRAELIQNWVRIDFNEAELPLKRKCIETERIVTGLIGKNFIPSYPLFILLILQQLRTGTKVDTNLGDYGYLYGSLITMSMQKNSKPNFPIDLQLGFLSELAYYMHFNRSTFRLGKKVVIDKSKLFEFTNDYNSLHRVELDCDTLLESFKSSNILEENGEIYFKYSYIYYYFVGKYFSDHITEHSIESQVEDMCKKLHFYEFSNIIMFICYQSKNPFIARTIIKTSRMYFDTNNEFDLVEHSKQLSDSVASLPDIIEQIEQSEDSKNESDDNSSKNDDLINSDESEIEDEKTFDTDISKSLQINVAFLSINLMGSILRNFPSLDGDLKDELAKESSSLGLRVLDYVFSIVEPTLREIVEYKLIFIRENHKDWQIEKICKSIRESLVGLLVTSSFICIKIISNSLGNNLIDPILDVLLKQNLTNNSYRFIDLSIKLDHSKRFPEKEIFNLARELHKKPFPYYLLQYLVSYYFYVLEGNSALKESVITRLREPNKKTLRSPSK